jgi:hypothetical protein
MRQTILLLFLLFIAVGTFLQIRCLATMEDTYKDTDWWEGFMKYAVKIGSGAMNYATSFRKNGFGIQKLVVGDKQTSR